MFGFTSLGHVAIRTKDIAKSLEFYTERLRFKEMLRLNYADGSLWLVYLRVTDTQYLELFPNGVGDRAPNREAVAVNHFCLTVDNIEQTVRDLAAAGIPLARELLMGPDGNPQAWFEDPDGNRIEIMELRDGCLQFEAVKGIHNGTKPVTINSKTPPPAIASR
jgi:lactoylglutathione lyase